MATDREILLRRRLPESIYYALQPDLEKLTTSSAEIIRMATPDSIDWQLRARIDCLVLKLNPRSKRDLTEQEFHEGICDYLTFKKRLTHEWKRVFLTRPLDTFSEATDHILTSLTARFYEIASLPISSLDHRGNKTVDLKNARLMMDLAKLMLDRKLGAAVQRNVNVSVETKVKPVTVSLAQIESEIKSLEAEFEQPSAVPGVIEITEVTEGRAGETEGAKRIGKGPPTLSG